MFRLADYIVQVVFIGFLVFGLFFLPGVALGDDSVSIPLVVPFIDWVSISSALIGSLTILAVVGIGIFLSIWVILKAMALAVRTSSSGTSSYREFLSARGIPVDDYEDFKDEDEEEYGFYPSESYANRF